MRKQQPKVIDPFIGPARAAERLDVSRSSLYSLVKKGELPPPAKLPGLRRVAWRESVIEAYRERCDAPPPTAAAA